MLNKLISPMLLQPAQPEDIQANWPASLKWDGFRILIHYDRGKVRAFTRHGTEVTERFPELENIVLPVKSAILDGECIAFDVSQPQDRPLKLWWDDAMTRFNAKKKTTVIQLSKTLKAHFPLWDVLYLDGSPMLRNTFTERRNALQTILGASETISITPLYDNGEELFKNAAALGMEGICQYNPSGLYHLDCRPKNTIHKIKAYQYAICQIGSIRNDTFGWGLYQNGKYVGVTEFPPSKEILRQFHVVKEKLIRGEGKGWTYLEPLLSCKVKFQCHTKDGKLRSPKIEEIIINQIA